MTSTKGENPKKASTSLDPADKSPNKTTSNGKPYESSNSSSKKQASFSISYSRNPSEKEKSTQFSNPLNQSPLEDPANNKNLPIDPQESHNNENFLISPLTPSDSKEGSEWDLFSQKVLKFLEPSNLKAQATRIKIPIFVITGLFALVISFKAYGKYSKSASERNEEPIGK